MSSTSPHVPQQPGHGEGMTLFPLWARSFLIRTCPCAKAGLDWGMLLLLSWLQCVTQSVFLDLCLHSPVVISKWAFTLPLYQWVKNGHLYFTRSQVMCSDCLGSDWEFGLELKTGLSKRAGWELLIIFLIFLSKLAWKCLSMSLFP